MKKLIILCVILMITLMVPMAAAITVDGVKESEWDENWAFGQTGGTGYSPLGPFGDRLVTQQGAFSIDKVPPWLDFDPKDDAGDTPFTVSMARAGDNDSGSDIKSLYMHFNASSFILYGFCEVYGIPGDLDGDGSTSTNSTFGDTSGIPGPAGIGLGASETWKIRATQDGNFVDITVSDNNWTVEDSIAMDYDDVFAKFEPTAGGGYEIEIHNMITLFDMTLGASPIMIEVLAGANDDGIGEDTATAYVHLPYPRIQIVKTTSDGLGGWMDGPLLNTSEPVTWKYVITNIGDVPLTGIVVTDNKEGVIPSGASLNPGISMTVYQAGTTVSSGSYSNIATVVGYYQGYPVDDTDPSNYRTEPVDVPALTPTGLLGLIGALGMIGIFGVKRRD